MAMGTAVSIRANNMVEHFVARLGGGGGGGTVHGWFSNLGSHVGVLSLGFRGSCCNFLSGELRRQVGDLV